MKTKQAKWKPVIFNACGRVSHVGRARWNARLGGWQVREMRPGHGDAPDLYGPSALYSIHWITKAARDKAVEEARKEHEEFKRREQKQEIVNSISAACGIGIGDKAGLLAVACKETGAPIALVREVFNEQVSGGGLVRQDGKWTVCDDIPF